MTESDEDGEEKEAQTISVPASEAEMGSHLDGEE